MAQDARHHRGRLLPVAVGAVAVLAVVRLAVVGVERWRGLVLDSPQVIVRPAQVGLVGVVLAVWLPRGEWTTLGGVVLVVGTGGALPQHDQAQPVWQADADMAHEEPAGVELRPALPDIG